MAASAPVSSSIASRLREDVAFAMEHLLQTTVLGSVLIPRVARRALLNAVGARAESAPGTAFSLSGPARNLRVGRGVFFNKHVSIEAVAPVTIGDGTAIGMQVMIMTSHHDIDEAGRWDAVASGRPVTIGTRVWIGGRATVLPGAHIEDDVVVAAGAVVAGRLATGGVYAGVPARRIRELTGPARDASAAAEADAAAAATATEDAEQRTGQPADAATADAATVDAARADA